MALEKPQLMADDCDIGARRDEGLDVVVFDDSGAQLVCLAHDARTLISCGYVYWLAVSGVSVVPVANARCASLAAKIAAISAFDGLGVGKVIVPTPASFKRVGPGEITR